MTLVPVETLNCTRGDTFKLLNGIQEKSCTTDADNRIIDSVCVLNKD